MCMEKITTTTKESQQVRLWRMERGISLSKMVELAPVWKQELEAVTEERDNLKLALERNLNSLNESFKREEALRRMQDRTRGNRL